LRSIHQLLPDLVYGDAISNYAIAMKKYFRGLGYKSDILASRCYDERVAKEGKLFKNHLLKKSDGVLYHYSIGSELTSIVVEHPGPKCLIYHNITPGKFFKPYRPEYANTLEQGRSQLREIAAYFPLAVGDSAFNVSELSAIGFKNPFVFPIPVSIDKWNTSPDSCMMHCLQDGKANLIFVGRIIPSKCQHDLVRAFSGYLSMDPDARLILVGENLPDDPYYGYLVRSIQRYGLSQHVVLTGKVTDAELHAYYRTADLFWTMSEHEGFCVPLIEAMWFDVPILAYKSTAIPETLEKAGMMFTSKKDMTSVAALAKLLVRDQGLRKSVLSAQRKRRKFFLPERLLPQLDRLIKRMEEQFG
jgi:glycosyltransferase involved in cell wall biosynthesis